MIKAFTSRKTTTLCNVMLLYAFDRESLLEFIGAAHMFEDECRRVELADFVGLAIELARFNEGSILLGELLGWTFSLSTIISLPLAVLLLLFMMVLCRALELCEWAGGCCGLWLALGSGGR